MPALIDPHDVYAANRTGKLSAAVAGFPERIYVPISGRNRVDVIDPTRSRSSINSRWEGSHST
jgi:hypothetical protein